MSCFLLLSCLQILFSACSSELETLNQCNSGVSCFIPLVKKQGHFLDTAPQSEKCTGQSSCEVQDLGLLRAMVLELGQHVMSQCRSGLPWVSTQPHKLRIGQISVAGMFSFPLVFLSQFLGKERLNVFFVPLRPFPTAALQPNKCPKKVSQFETK